MSAFITSAWGVISASANLVIGTKQMTEKARRLIQTEISNDQLNAMDRAKLMSIQLRIECLVQPLNTLLLWSIDKDSTVQPVVINAMQTVAQVCQFINRIDRANFEKSDSDFLSFFLRELDFACQSVSMSLSLMNIMRQEKAMGNGDNDLSNINFANNLANPTPSSSSSAGPNSVNSSNNIPPNNEYANATFFPTSNNNKNISKPAVIPALAPSNSVSPGALLKASKRIQEIFGASGDVCVCQGTLFTRPAVVPSAMLNNSNKNEKNSKDVTSKSSVEPEKTDKNNFSESGNGSSENCHNPHPWSEGYRASFKIVAQNKTFVLRLDPVLVLDHNEANRAASPKASPRNSNEFGPAGSSSHFSEASSIQLPVAVALDFALVDAESQKLPEAFKASSLIDDVPEGFLQSSMPRGYSAALNFSDLGFTDGALLDPECDAIVIADDLKQKADNIANAKEYCFVFDLMHGEPGRDVSFTPVEFFYTCRLCAIDDTRMDNQTGGFFGGANPAANSSDERKANPFHLFASDEILCELLSTKRKNIGREMNSAAGGSSSAGVGAGGTVKKNDSFSSSAGSRDNPFSLNLTGDDGKGKVSLPDFSPTMR